MKYVMGHDCYSYLTLAITSVAVVSLIAEALVADWSLGGAHFR